MDLIRSIEDEKIRKYRLKESLRITLKKRPDLLEKKELNNEEKILLKEIREEEENGFN